MMVGGMGHQGGPRSLLESYGNKELGRVQGRVLLRLLRFVLPFWRQLLAAGILMVITTGANLLIPFLTRFVIDVRIGEGDLRGLASTGILLAGVMAGSYLTAGLQSYLLAQVGQRSLFSLRNRLFDHLQELSVAYHDSHIVGVTVSRVINDVGVINNLLSEGLITLLGDTILLVGTIVVMLTMDVRLALITFSIIPVMVVATVIFSRKARVAFRDTREKVATLVGNLAENIGGMREIQSYAQETESHRQFEQNNRKNRVAHVRAMSLSFVFLPTVDFLSIAATCIVLLAGGIMVVRGSVTIGIIVAFIAYVSRFFMPIRELSQLYTTLQSATAGGERVLEMLDSVPAVEDGPDAVDLATIEGRIEFRGVSFEYQKGSEVLHDINLDIEPGETVAIVGPTGAGKTTIINLVCRFYQATSGEILIDGRPVADITSASLHRVMGYVAQDPFLFTGTIAENIAYGREGASMESIIEAATLAEAHPFINALTDGYQTVMLEGGVNLSTGQRQLVSIARAILVDPRLLIMDEATSSVDTVTEGLIQKALAYLLRDRTAIVIAHRLTTVRGSNRIFVIDQGRFIEEGSHDELMAAGGVYSGLYERQFIK